MEQIPQINWTSGEFYDALQSLLGRRVEIESGLIDPKTLKVHIENCSYPDCISSESGLIDAFPITLKHGTISQNEWERLKPMILLVLDVAIRTFSVSEG